MRRSPAFLCLAFGTFCGVLPAQTQVQWSKRIIGYTANDATFTGDLDKAAGNLQIKITRPGAVFTGTLAVGLPELLTTQSCPPSRGGGWLCVIPATGSLQLSGKWDLDSARYPSSSVQASVKVTGPNSTLSTSILDGPRCGDAPVPLAPYTSGDKLETATLKCPMDALYWDTAYGRLETYTSIELNLSNNSGSFGSHFIRIPITEVYMPCNTCAPAASDLAITGVEPIQVIQSSPPPGASPPAYPTREIPLIAGKPMIVRVYVNTLGKDAKLSRNVSAVLRGYRAADGPTPTTFRPFEPSTTAWPYAGPMPPTVPPDLGDLSFAIPADWLKAEGVYSLEAEIVPPPAFQDSDPSNNKVTRTMTLVRQPSDPLATNPAGRLRVGFVSICNQVAGDAAPLCPGPAVANQTRFVEDLFPIAAGGLDFFRAANINTYTFPITSDIGYTQLLTKLRLAFLRIIQASGRDMDQLIGFVPNRPGVPWGGLADALWAGGRGEVALVTDYTQTANAAGFTAMNVAHELGHNLGLRHVNQTDPAGGCTRLARDDCSPWPYNDPKIQHMGYDVRNRWVVHNVNRYDLMSYCSNSAASNIWISPYHYNWLFDHELAPSPSPPKPGTCGRPLAAAATPKIGVLENRRMARRQYSAEPQEYLMVSGTAKRDGSAGSLDPAFRIVTRRLPVPSDPDGDHCLRFFGAEGTAGTDFCFSPSFIGLESGEPLEESPFAFVVAAPQGTTRMALLRGGAEVASLSGGSQPPSISVTRPRVGDRWEGGSQSLAWSATGSGPATLTYIVDYSSDGGTTWMPLALETTENSMSVNPASLEGGPSVHFRVHVSDGLNTSSAQVGPIEIVQNPRIEADPVAVDFRKTLPGLPVERQVTLVNRGSGPLRVSAIQISDPAFTLVSPSVPFTVYGNDTVSLRLHFSPAATGPVQATMTIASNAGDTPSLTIPLQGTGIENAVPDAAVTPASLDFGRLAQGASAPLSVTLQNFGPASLNVSSLSISGSGFSLEVAQGEFRLAANENKVLPVRFAPQQTGVQTGSLAVQSDDPARPAITVPLRGEGAAAITLSPAALDFGRVTVGQSKDLNLTVSNNGSAPLAVQRIDISNTRFSVISPAVPFPVAAGAQQTVTVRFAPMAAGSQTGALSVAGVQVALSGTGESGTTPQPGSASIRVTPPSLDFGSVAAGESKELPVTLGNVGNAALVVNAIASSNARFTVAAPSLPFTVAAGAQQRISVRFAPNADSAQTGTLAIASNDPANPTVNISLSGVGVQPVILFSDSFHRDDAGACALGPPDFALGGNIKYYYLPIFSTVVDNKAVPVGAEIGSGSLRNPGFDYGGVQFSAVPTVCPNGSGTSLRQDLGISVDLRVASNDSSLVSQAGPYFRSRTAATGDEIIGGTSAGYWVQLHSTGEVKIKRLNPAAVIAFTGRPAAFDNKAFHTLEMSAQGETLQMALDGKLLTFNQGGNLTTTVSIPPAWDGPPPVGSNNGAAGIAFGAEENRYQVGDQRARNLVVSTERLLSGLPVQNNFR